MDGQELFTPQWVQDAVFYQIFPDRFASSRQVLKPGRLEAWDAPPTHEGFKGGDLLGVCEHLDVLQDLGINAIYLNPIFQSASNHRYHTHDYLRVDPLLGGDEAFGTLIKEAHRRGIRVILDGVFNHASRGFFQFNHILEVGKASPYRDWFRVKGFPLHAYEGKPNYDCWWGIAALPEFDTRNPQVRDFIYQVARTWLERGIDGWRLDVPNCIDDDSFWQEFRQVVKAANPQAYIVGEIADDAGRWLQGDQFDGVMNYLLAYACWGFFGGEGLKRELLGNWLNYAAHHLQSEAGGFARQVEELLRHYPRAAVMAQLNLLDSHDTARILTVLGEDKDLLKLAVLFIMTYPGAPCIYYGDEIGMDGGHDPDCRRAFPLEETAWDQGLRSFYKECIRLRLEHPALRSGEFRTLHAVGEVFVYLRRLGDERLVVAINRSRETVHLDLGVKDLLREGVCLHNLLGAGEAQVSQGVLRGLVVAPKTGIILDDMNSRMG